MFLHHIGGIGNPQYWGLPGTSLAADERAAFRAHETPAGVHVVITRAFLP